MAKDECVPAFDVGGSTTDYAILGRNLEIIGGVKRMSTEESRPKKQLIDTFRGPLGELATEATMHDFTVVAGGIAMPTPFEYDGPEEGVSRMTHKFRAREGINVKKLLETGLDFPLYFDNDAKLFARGVWLRHFAGRTKPRRFVAATIGTGIGAGGGDAENLRDFDLWKEAYGDPGRIVEDYVSARAVVGSYQRATDEQIAAQEIARRARLGNQVALQAYHNLGEHLGLSLARTLPQGLDPEIVVCGGQVAKSLDLFGAIAEAAYRSEVGKSIPFEATREPHLALYGAAFHAFSRYAIASWVRWRVALLFSTA